MAKQVRSCLMAGAMLVATVSAAMAASGQGSSGHFTGQKAEVQRGSVGNIATPGPIAGAGIPFLLIAGAYAFKRYRRQGQ